MNGAESDSDVVDVQFSRTKSRSPPRHKVTEIDGLTEDIFMPLVAGDEFEEQDLEGNVTFTFLTFFLARKIEGKFVRVVLHIISHHRIFWRLSGV